MMTSDDYRGTVAAKNQHYTIYRMMPGFRVVFRDPDLPDMCVSGWTAAVALGRAAAQIAREAPRRT